MGDHIINLEDSKEDRLTYINHLLKDLKSLDYMLSNDLIDKGVTRLGAEQEFCLVGRNWRPASNARDILKAINDNHFTTELAKFNIEINLDPFEANKLVFQQIQSQLTSLLEKARKVAHQFGSKVILTGILPSISLNEIGIDYMTPEPRYYALNEMLFKHRGGDFKLQLSGVDELSIVHNTIMFEACNTSFQLHLQIDPDDFESSYNWAQAISGPVLATAVNSPLLLGKELWQETRIALFQQSIDTRKISRTKIDQQSRVSFGSDWVRGSIANYFRKEISRFPIMLTKKIEKDSYTKLLTGNTPKLKALNLHNSTVYRWNRPCYGVGGGKAHIRIENRYIPSGPSVIDEIANMALWVGLMKGRTHEHEKLWEKMDFKDAKSNFIRAANHGTEAIMSWMGEKIKGEDLLINKLLPIAKNGLLKLGVSSSDIDNYLGLIRDRVTGNTGSQWIINNYRNLTQTRSEYQALLNITQGIYNNQWSGKVVSQWPDLDPNMDSENHISTVGHIMTSSTITANYADSAQLTLELMRWNNIHHLPVLDDNSKLVGLVTWSLLDKYKENVNDPNKLLCVEDIMVKEVVTVKRHTPIEEALELMNKYNIGCLPIIDCERLVGIITHRDLERLKHGKNIQ